jgi:triosephosphate isomerase
MRRGLAIGNWKMNVDRASAMALIDAILAKIPEVNADLVVCPPYLYIPDISQRIANTTIICGAQNVAAHETGAYTGEISTAMLKEFDCKYAIVGHSERRQYYADDNLAVAERFCQAINGGIIPILSTSETLKDRDNGTTFDIISEQINTVINKAGIESFMNAVISYEPLWAIGTGQTATDEQAQDVHYFIRQLIASKSQKVADKIQILYGGSVKSENAQKLLAMPDIDGVLVGGASLTADSFLKIYSSFQK